MGLGSRLLLLGVAVAVPVEAIGQERWPATLEVVVGLGVGHTSGEYRENNTGVTAEFLVGHRIGHTERGHYFAALTVGGQGSGTVTSDCLPADRGGCVPSFPSFESVGVLAGWEHGSTRYRALTGPSAVRAHGDWDTIVLGWVGRLDAVVPLTGRLSVLGSFRVLTIPDYSGDSFAWASFVAGLRLR